MKTLGRLICVPYSRDRLQRLPSYRCATKSIGNREDVPPRRDKSFSLLFMLIENDPSSCVLQFRKKKRMLTQVHEETQI